MKDYIWKIVGERTTLDGTMLIAVCGAVILFGGIAKMLAWAGLAYGIWTALKTEDQIMAYSEQVLDHYNNPRNVGKLDKDAEDVGTGMVGAPACGDVMQLQIKVNENGIIEDARFKTYGCGSAIASSSLLTEWVKGRSLDEAANIRNTDIAEELCLPPVKIHCSVLAEDAIKAAINDYRMKHENRTEHKQTTESTLG